MNQFFLILITLIVISASCKKSDLSNNIPEDNNEVVINQPVVPPSVRQSDPDNERYAWQKPELVIEKIGNINGKVVADIGAGTGYFAFRLIRNAERVIAVDIDPNMINLINIFKENLDSLQQSKIETRLATENSPMLSKEEVDIAIIINTIGFIEDRKLYLSNLKESLKPKGEIMIVDFKMKRIPDEIAPPVEYRVNLLELENLLTEIGYELVLTDDRSLDYQFILKARKSL